MWVGNLRSQDGAAAILNQSARVDDPAVPATSGHGAAGNKPTAGQHGLAVEAIIRGCGGQGHQAGSSVAIALAADGKTKVIGQPAGAPFFLPARRAFRRHRPAYEVSSENHLVPAGGGKVPA